MTPKRYDSTVARIAGNIAAGLVTHPDVVTPFSDLGATHIAEAAVSIARLIVAEVERTEPKPEAES